MGKFLLVIVVFAALVYAAFWLLERRRRGKLPQGRPAPKPKRAVAPDDDEDFLRDLNRRNRKRGRDKDPDKPSD